MGLGNIGIGLGGFADAFDKSRKARLDEERLDQQSARQKAYDARQSEQDARQKVLDGREDTEYNRKLGQRDAVDQVNDDAKATFAQRVKAGTEKPDDFEGFWTGYALPKLQQTYLLNGDTENAKRVQEWGESAATKAGAKLSMSSIMKAQTGDFEGALTDAMGAAKKSGYMDHGYEILGHDAITAPDGKPLGYRIKLRTPDGKDVEQDIQNADMPKLISTFLNPQAAWQSQVDAQAAKTKRSNDLADYTEKKKVDKAYGTGDNRIRQEAIKTLRTRMDGGLAGKDPKFDDLPEADKEAEIQKEVELTTGAPGIAGSSPASVTTATLPSPTTASPLAPAAGAPGTLPQSTAPGRQSIVDTMTGKAVPMPTARPASNAGPAPAPMQQPAAVSQGDNVSSLLQTADQAVQQGEDAGRVAAELKSNGVSEDQWPGSLRTALARQRQQGMPVVGLGQD